MGNAKNDVRTRILNNATEEFYVKDFSGASMRKIARKSRMVVGNVYRYFDNKENLFNVVIEPAYLSLISLVNLELEDTNDLTPILDELTKVCITYPKQIVILIKRYIDTDNHEMLNNLKELISKRLKSDIPHIEQNQINLIFHLTLSGVLFVSQNYENDSLETALKSFFVLLFQDIEKRVGKD